MASGTTFNTRHPIVVNVNDYELTPLLASHEKSYQKELFFDELFQEKCNISVVETEISFIQKSVESFVSKVIQRVLDSEQYQTFIKKDDRKRLIEFSEKCSTDNILKVGSFYECTKNHYPDEFDFIFILGECEYKNQKLSRDLTSDLSDIFHKQLEEVVTKLRIEPDSAIECCNYTGLHGPASKIKLDFKENTNVKNRSIDVDISPASRVRFETGLPDDLKVHYDEWQEMLLNTGSVLVIKVYKKDHPKHKTGVNFTITETEQHFVKHEMSEKQRKIYRLLKYVFNGKDANESIRVLIRRPDNKLTTRIKYIGKKLHGPKIVYDMPSYTIKTFMFHHVHQCKNADCSVPECLTEVLKHFLTVFNRKVDKYTTIFQNWLGGRKGFSVSIETMLGHPLEIADDYVSAAVIAKKVSDLIKSIEDIGESRGDMHASVKDHIPITHQNENIVKNVLDEKRERTKFSPRRSGVMLLRIAMYLSVYIPANIIGYNLASNACAQSSEASANKSSFAQYCCDGIQDHNQGFVNVTCSKNKNIANNLLTVAGQANYRQTTNGPANERNNFTELKCMASKLNQTEEEGLYFVWNCGQRNREITGNDTNKEVEFYIYCNASSNKFSVSDAMLFIQNEEKTCLSFISSYYTPQQPPFLKVMPTNTSGNEATWEHYICVTDNYCTADILSSFPIQTCTEIKTAGDMRTEVCCNNYDRYLKEHNDAECHYYKELLDIILSISRIAVVLVFFVPDWIIYVRSKLTIIGSVKQLRRSMDEYPSNGIWRSSHSVVAISEITQRSNLRRESVEMESAV